MAFIPNLQASLWDPPGDGSETPSEAWSRLYGLSSAVRARAALNASLTFPEVYPVEGSNPDYRPAQTAARALGYMGMNAFVNKISRALFSASGGFFRLSASEEGLAEYLESNPGATAASVEAQLAGMEKKAVQAWSRRGERDRLTTALAHVAIIGQACLWFDKDSGAEGTLRVIPLQNYAIKRGIDGEIHELVVAEAITLMDAPKEAQEALAGMPGYTLNSRVSLYSRWRRVSPKTYEFHQSVEEGQPIPGLTRKIRKDKLPVAVPYWKLEDQASYGISLVDGIQAELIEYNEVCARIQKTQKALTNYRILVDPGGQTDVADFQETQEGDAVPGRRQDIAVSETGDSHILAMLYQHKAELEQIINAAFLRELNVFRQSERTTAEEVRAVREALDGQYVAMYNALAHRLQTPLARWILELAKLDLDDSLEITILTGEAALDRTTEVGNLTQALTILQGFGTMPEPLLARVNWQAAAEMVGAGLSVDLQLILKSEEQYQQEQEELQKQQMAMQVAAQQAAQPEQSNV